MSSQKPIDELVRLIRLSKEKSIRVTKLAGDYLSWGQYVSDLSEASDAVIGFGLSINVDWESTIDSWQRINEHQDNILATFGKVPIRPIMTSGSSVAYKMSYFARPENIVLNVSPEKREDAQVAANNLSQVINRLANREEVLAIMSEFGLANAAPDKQSPIELFQSAWAAFEKPVTENSPVITSLIPMRQSILDTVEALLRRRPKQEPAKSHEAKIISLGSQLAREGISMDEIMSWAVRWGAKGGSGLVDELSGSKDKKYSREEWNDLLRRATLFIRELLEGIDPAKLR